MTARFVLAALLLTLAPAAAQVTATFTPLGTGCARPTRTPPVLSATTLPYIGTELVVTVTNLIPNTEGLIIAGESGSTWLGLTLPINMAFLGGPNCTLYSSGECMGPCGATSTGTVVMRAVIPNDRALIGKEFWMQFWSRDVLSNAHGYAMSNGGRFKFGG
ncbi:MAG: hypothetical protein KDC87_08840 [Planctomycetes bacterium]|nr:hypothetical protein [Planctomycetota bacterium]MCB9872089.1 hypothetical protein [Planctomycetota bacterium]